MPKKKHDSILLRNIATLFTGNVITQIIPFLLLPIVTRLYSPTDFGTYGIFMSIVTTTSAIASLMYEYAIIHTKEKKEASLLVASCIFISLISSGLAYILLLLIPYLRTTLQLSLIPYSDFFIPFGIFSFSTSNIFVQYLIRQDRYAKLSKLQILKSLAINTTTLVLGFYSFNEAGMIVGMVVGQVIFTAFAINTNTLSHACLEEGAFTKAFTLLKKNKNFPKYSAPGEFLNAISGNIYIFLFTAFFTPQMVGAIYFSIKILNRPLSIIIQSISGVLYKRFSELTDIELKDFYLKTSLLLLGAGTLTPLIVFSIPESLFLIIFGPKWQTSFHYLKLFSFIFAVHFAAGSLSSIYFRLSLQKAKLILSSINLFFSAVIIYTGAKYFSTPFPVILLYAGFRTLFLLLMVITPYLHMKKTNFQGQQAESL